MSHYADWTHFVDCVPGSFDGSTAQSPQEREWVRINESHRPAVQTDHESATARVRDFLAARASMGDNVDKSAVLDIWVKGEQFRLTTDDLRILSGWDGEPMEQGCGSGCDAEQ